jgi:hypothetical protein
MTYKNTITMMSLGVIVVFTIASIFVSVNEVFAASVTNFKMADDTYAKVTFTFRDGVEELYFPVFKMTSSYVENKGTSFQLQGTIGNYPYLHEAMDQSYDYRLASSSIQYDYKQFVVDVDLVKGGISQKKLGYSDCQVIGASVDTTSDLAEGYVTTKTGFAMIDVIDFACSGLQQIVTEPSQELKPYSQNQVHDYGKNSQKLAENVHSYATFSFNDGIEKIDFPVFKMNSGFEEKSTQRPSFTMQGIATSHILLDKAITKAKNVGSIPSIYNDDFQVTVDFANDSKTLRTLAYSDCRVDEYKIDTLFDKEEGYTGKSGFAIVEEITVSCAGLTTKNYSGEKTDPKNIVNTNSYIMGGFTQAIATVKLDTGEQEKIDFPVFKQTSTTSSQTINGGSGTKVIFSRLNPSFQLQGVAGNFPILYDVVDQIRTRGQVSGTDFQGLFSVDVDLVHNDQLVRTYQYTSCRVTNYDTDTVFNAEEGYVGANGFALVSVYDIECKGYHPSNPPFEAMQVVEKANTISSSDLMPTDKWGPGFK